MEQVPTATRHAENLRWAYRMVLGRDPENEAVHEAWSRRPPQELLAFLAGCPEGIARQKAGYPAAGAWLEGALPRAAVLAAHQLLHGTEPTEAQVAAALRAHASPASFRRSFLGWLEAGGIPALMDARPEVAFPLLGRRLTLRGTGQEPYWPGLAEGVPDPRIARLARLAAAAFPDGGAGRVVVDAQAGTGLAAIAMGAALPYHAALLGLEAEAEALELLRHNLPANGIDGALIVEATLGAGDEADLSRRRLDGVLAEQGLERLDLLRLSAGGEETAALFGSAQAIRRDRPIIVAEFNPWNLMTVARENPLAVLEEWNAAFPHLVGFDDAGDPLALSGAEGLPWLLHAALTRPGGVGDVVLCHDLGWVERWA